MIGEKLGKYTILDTLGSGSMGTVYKAEAPEGGIVAVKLIRSQILYDLDKRERFLQGILTASETRHKGICPILEIGDENDDFFVVMPLLEGKTLERHMERKPLQVQQALEIAVAVGDALAAIHRSGGVHRGLKPSNIWINNEGSVVVADFGVARFTEIARRGRSRQAGTRVDFADTLIPMSALAYMSPEQVRGDAVDLRTDIFAFGALLYEMVTGRHPFESRNTLSRMSAILEAEPPPLASRLSVIPVEVERIIRRALAKDPKDRYQGMDELLSDLEAVRRKGALSKNHPVPQVTRRTISTVQWLVVSLIATTFLAALVYFLSTK